MGLTFFVVIKKTPSGDGNSTIANPSTKMGVTHNSGMKKAPTYTSLDHAVKNVRCQSQMGKIVPSSSIYLEVTRK